MPVTETQANNRDLRNEQQRQLNRSDSQAAALWAVIAVIVIAGVAYAAYERVHTATPVIASDQNSSSTMSSSTAAAPASDNSNPPATTNNYNTMAPAAGDTTTTPDANQVNPAPAATNGTTANQ